LITKHTWAADATQTLTDMAWTAAKSATLTAKFDQCTVDAVKYTDKAACAAAVKANKKEIDDANEFNKTAADADKKVVPAAIDCCTADKKKTGGVDSKWTATGATMTRAIDKTTKEEKWTIKTVTGTQTTTLWNHTTGADLTTADVPALAKAADTAGWK
jgi:hypothetical protein